MIRNKLYYECRLALLEGRAGKDNQAIVRKLRRKIRSLSK